MVKAKTVHLQNYCGYTDTVFDLDGKDFVVFYGPNGIGKSTCLDALRMAANPFLFGRGQSNDPLDRHATLMRKFVHDEEYIPHVDSVQKDKVKKDMLIDVTFSTDDGDKHVVLDNYGLKLNELTKGINKNGYAFFADADHPINTQKFQLAAEQGERFLEFCEEVYGYECFLGSPVKMQNISIYTDFIIKKGDVRVHFKRMSAGERKIATLISDLCQPINTNGLDILMVDNVEMHVYWKRHTRMVDKLRACFPDKQILTTTHSAVVIAHVEPECHFDLEVYRPEYKLLEANERHVQELEASHEG